MEFRDVRPTFLCMIPSRVILFPAEAGIKDLFCFAAAVRWWLSLKTVRVTSHLKAGGNAVGSQYVTLHAVRLLKYAQRASLMEVLAENLSERAQQREHDLILKLNILTSCLI